MNLRDYIEKEEVEKALTEGRTPQGMELTKNQIKFRKDTMSTVQELLKACKKLEAVAKKAKSSDYGYPEDDFELRNFTKEIGSLAGMANNQSQTVSTVPGAR